MVFYLPENIENAPSLDDLTPRQIVTELDKYVVGQANAKRSVAVALRNRMRRQKLAPELADDILPKNIIMIGPTGVGKTEIARRLARLTNSPFLKIEASRFTEVGYVGRDVESMIRDLVEVSIDMVREEKVDEVAEKAEQNAEERLLDLLLPPPSTMRKADKAPRTRRRRPRRVAGAVSAHAGKAPRPVARRQAGRPGSGSGDARPQHARRLKSFLRRAWKRWISTSKISFPASSGSAPRSGGMHVTEAMEYLIQEEENRLIDMDQVTRTAVERAEQSGIIFLDEIDKIAGRERGGGGPDVSREGVQRDILPIVEGTTVNTRYGMVRTDHILFIAAGAFHVTKPSDLIPELQGRFPIRVELHSLTTEDFIRILKEPKSALVKQYIALLETEGIKLTFSDDPCRKSPSLRRP